MKTCTKCRFQKDRSDFHKDASQASGLSCWCKSCVRAKQAAHRKRPEVKAASREYKRTPKQRQKARELWAKNRVANKYQERILVKQAKVRARRRGHVFDIHTADIQIPSHCPLLGVELRYGRKTTSPNSPSLDRIDPTQGYVKGNVWVISYRANTIKNNASLEELERIALGLRSRQK